MKSYELIANSLKNALGLRWPARRITLFHAFMCTNPKRCAILKSKHYFVNIEIPKGRGARFSNLRLWSVYIEYGRADVRGGLAKTRRHQELTGSRPNSADAADVRQTA